MGSKTIGWMCGAMVAVGVGPPADARETDPRLSAPLLRTGYSRSVMRRATVRNEALSLLGQTDRNGLRGARAHGFAAQFGPFDLALEASRMRGGRSGPEDRAAGDRYSASALVLDAGFDLGDGLRIGPTASLMHMKRHFSVVPSGLRPHTTDIASFGLRASLENGPALSLEYMNTTGRQVRSLERMAEIAGGAPLLGHGLRLGLTGGAKDPNSRGLTWGLTVSAIQRPRSEFALSEIAGEVADKRVAFAISKAFR